MYDVRGNREKEKDKETEKRGLVRGWDTLLHGFGHPSKRRVGIWAKSSSISSVSPADVNAIETLDKDFAP